VTPTFSIRTETRWGSTLARDLAIFASAQPSSKGHANFASSQRFEFEAASLCCATDNRIDAPVGDCDARWRASPSGAAAQQGVAADGLVGRFAPSGARS
jgi:hypothetical protein